MDPKTIIKGKKNDQRAALIKVDYFENDSLEVVEKFAEDVLQIILSKGIQEELFTFEEEQRKALGGNFILLDTSTEGNEDGSNFPFDVVINQDGTQGALVKLIYKTAPALTQEELQKMATAIATVGANNPTEYFSAVDAATEPDSEKKKQILLDQMYPDQSGKTIGEIASLYGFEIRGAISRVDGVSVTD